uniref:Hydroxylysine kinase n=1 Tax=Saccoglossus kowalevskii TaxID=10224 RepID=A0ABM0LV78_SACKO|nr:PREDICTED: hydroxylysine kinase-like [Saccoglossus kowalevskii]
MNAIQELMHIIELEERKTMVECVIRMFNSKVSPHLKKLKKGVIHGDYDPNNVIVSMLPHEGEDVRPEVCGIIDFSDARYSYYVFELAICIADFLMFSKDANHSLISTRLSEGYQSKFQLNELEKSLLPICIASRLCQVAVLGTNELKVQRYNNYIDNFVSKAWNCLHSTLANLSKIIEL